MGLVKHLLFWPVTLPSTVVEFSVRQVEGVARGHLTNDASVKEDLLALQMELELGEIDDEEYTRREAELMKRLREVRSWREHFGLEERWTPLSYGAQSPSEGGARGAGPDTAPSDGADASAPGGSDEPPEGEPWPPSSSDTSPGDS